MILLALALLGLSAVAAPEGPALSRAQAQAAAQARSLELVVAEAEIRAAQAVARTAGELPNPTVGVSYGPDAPQLFGTLEQRFPVLGQRGSAIRAAEGELEVTRAQKQVRALALAVEVDRAYTAAAAAQAQVLLAQEAAALARELAEANTQKFTAGLASELDAEQARLALRRAEQDLLDRQSAAFDARSKLGELLALAELPAAADGLLPLPPAPRILEAPASPEQRRTELAVAAAQARIARERAQVLPVPAVSLEVERTSAEPAAAPPVPSAQVGLRVGVSFELPLLNQRGGAIGEQQAAETKAQAERDQAARHVASARRAAAARFAAASHRAGFYQDELVPEAVHVRDLARQAYALGRTPLVSLLQAESDLNHVRSTAVDSAAEVWDALADLEESGVAIH